MPAALDTMLISMAITPRKIIFGVVVVVVVVAAVLYFRRSRAS